MIKNSHNSWVETWGTESAQNSVLKWFLLFFLLVVVVETVGISFLANREPIIVGIGPNESRVLTVVSPQEMREAEIKRALSTYLNVHYNWEESTIDKAFQSASHYIAEDFLTEFTDSNSTQLTVAKQRKLSQKFYLSSLRIDLKKRTAVAIGDRILTIGSLRAANPMTLELEFEYGDRTNENPEGIYIIAEKAPESAQQYSGGKG